MKKVFILFLSLLGLLVFRPDSAFAQDSTISKKELKAIASLEKAKSTLAISQAKLPKMQQDYDAKRSKFEKQNSKGKLSPNAVASHTKKLDKLSKKIKKEESLILDLEKYIEENGGD